MVGCRALFQILNMILLMAFSACQSEDTVGLDYPMVMTLAADHITTSSARLHAEITDGSPEEISEYGFVWGTSIILNINDSEKASAAGSPSGLTYSHDVSFLEDHMETYYVKSYIKTGELIIYGNTVSFTTP